MVTDWRRGYDAYLFDIDGTLLNCKDAVHYFAFCEALKLLAGRSLNLDGVVTHGNTDVGILRDALRLADVEDAAWRPRIGDAQRAMSEYVMTHRKDLQADVLPGVENLLQELHIAGKKLGVATGNLQAIGTLKLEAAALDKWFDFGGYSDPYEYRRDVFAGAVEKARALCGHEARLLVLGDTPEDVKAARANDLDVVAVATGLFSFEDLAAEGPDWCLRTLEKSC